MGPVMIRKKSVHSKPARSSARPTSAAASGLPAQARWKCGVGLECSRPTGESFEAALRRAEQAGFRFVEPFVYSPVRQRLNSHVSMVSASDYHHLEADRSSSKRITKLLRQSGLSFSALDAHSTLLLPHFGVSQLTSVLEFASDLECPFVVSDEGPVPTDWMSLDHAFDLMCATLDAIIPRARKLGVTFALELHNELTVQPRVLERVLQRYAPRDFGINFDTGNIFLSGRDPVRLLRKVASRVVHVHVKDIPAAQLSLRGRVTGTRVGVTVGEGVVDMPAIVTTLANAGFDGVLSVECDTWEQARASRRFLESLLHPSARPKTSPQTESAR
jgi:sugar phosphate isomerase/epimerase